MIIDVIMPKMGESITEGTILEWYKEVGEAIDKDETLLEIGTDKVDSEIPAPDSGIIIEILAKPNDVKEVGEVIARIDTGSSGGESPNEPRPLEQDPVEKKVKTNILTRIKNLHLEDKVYDVVIPTDEVVEIRNGKKVNLEKKTFPGYVLVRMDLDDTTWYEIRNTPSIIGFVGSGKRPISLSRREIERILGSNEVEEVKKESPKFKPDFEVGETVRVTTGPFADFNGIIEEINLDQSKVTVLVNIFGRETPVELGFTDIVKN